MTDYELLTMLKNNLNKTAAAQEPYLQQLLEVAAHEIRREGIKTLSAENLDDCNLIVMYAAYLFRKRAEDNPVMPRMLRYALNNRLFAEKLGGTT